LEQQPITHPDQQAQWEEVRDEFGEEWNAALRDDPDLAPLLRTLQTGEPAPGSTRTARRLVQSSADYTIRQGLLVRVEADRYRTAVPREMRSWALGLGHDDPRAGHQGHLRTAERIVRRWWWPGMRQEINRYVDTCPRCQEAKVPVRKPAGLLKSIDPAAKFERWMLD